MTIKPKLNAAKEGVVSIIRDQNSHMVHEVLDIIAQNKSAALKRTVEDERKTLPYQIAYAQEYYSDELWQAMEHRNLSQVEFAKKANVSKQFITKVFHGGNCTIETIVRLAFALDYKLNIHLTPNEVGCAWMHCLAEIPQRHVKQFSNPWAGSDYKPIVVMKESKCEKVAA